MIVESDIKFGDCKCEGRKYIQTILYNNIMIGVLIQSEQNSLLPIEERYQFGANQSNLPKNCDYIESEDNGWVFVISNTLSEFVQQLNNCIDNCEHQII